MHVLRIRFWANPLFKPVSRITIQVLPKDSYGVLDNVFQLGCERFGKILKAMQGGDFGF